MFSDGSGTYPTKKTFSPNACRMRKSNAMPSKKIKHKSSS